MSIQLFKPTFEVEECLKEIRECLETGWTGMGFKTVQFEEDWKKYTGLNHAYFLNSATAGLNLAVEIFKEQYGWDEDDEIVTTPLTFISTNHAITLSKMKAVFADVDDTLCLDPADVERKITPKTRAVMFVGLGGNVGQLNQIEEICKKHKLKLILDAAHMAGTRVNGEIAGKEADVIVYSFQAVKNLPTGDSGMICFKGSAFDAITRKKSWLGINKDTYARSTNSNGVYKWKYDVEYVGYKYNGNAIMAAIGIVQLRKLDRCNAYRRQLAEWYTEGFKESKNIKLIEVPEYCESSRHLFQIIVEDRDGLMEHLNKNGIFPGVHYTNNTEYSMYAYAKNTCPNATYASNRILSLPMHMQLTFDDVQYIIKTVNEFFID